MEIEQFVKDFSAQFEETDPGLFNPDLKFRDIPEWSSLIALAIIAMVDEVYHIKIKGDDIRNSNTIRDLFEIVKSRV